MMSDREKRVFGKYHVERADGRDKPGGDKEDACYFVLDIRHDADARIALQAYADSIVDRDFAGEIREMLAFVDIKEESDD
jgi:hypothetical protein